MADSHKDLEHLSTDLDQLHDEVEHLKKEHSLNLEESQHINQLDRQLHHALDHTKEIKKSNKILRLSRSLHKWVGLSLSIVLISLSITGIMLNHKKSLGYMPNVKHEASGPISQTISMEKIIEIAVNAANNKDIKGIEDIDRIDFRTKKMYAKVRFKDENNTEVIVDAITGKVLNTGQRTDVFLEKLHTGELFGDMFIIVTDAAAVSLVLLVASGIYIWIFPKWKRKFNRKLVTSSNKAESAIALENA